MLKQQGAGYDGFACRFKQVLELSSPRRGASGYLAQATGIGEQKWRNVMLGRTVPSVEMATALCRLRPQWAKWLMLGITDGENEAPPKLPELPVTLSPRTRTEPRTALHAKD